MRWDALRLAEVDSARGGVDGALPLLPRGAVTRTFEPGTPPPRRRLEMCASLQHAGIPCGVLLAPVLPFLTDSEEQLDAAVRAAAEAGAAYISPIVLHLQPGAREWWLAWLGGEHPDLLPRYAELYGERAYAPKAYQQRIAATVHELANRYRIPDRRALREGSRQERAQQGGPVPRPSLVPSPAETQLALL